MACRLDDQKGCESDGDEEQKKRDLSRQFIGDDTENDISVRDEHEKSFGIFFKLLLEFTDMLLSRELAHMTVVKDIVQDRKLDKLVGDKPVDDVHIIGFTEIARCRDIKTLIDDDTDDGDRYEDIEHHSSALGEIVDERLHALPF